MFSTLSSKAKSALAFVTTAATAIGTAMLTVTSTGVSVDVADVTNVQTSNGYYLTSSFEILKFLPTLAVLAAGIWVLNKVFGFVPKPSMSA